MDRGEQEKSIRQDAVTAHKVLSIKGDCDAIYLGRTCKLDVHTPMGLHGHSICITWIRVHFQTRVGAYGSHRTTCRFSLLLVLRLVIVHG